MAKFGNITRLDEEMWDHCQESKIGAQGLTPKRSWLWNDSK